MRNFFTLFFQEFRVLLKDRQALLVLFLMPMLLIFFISLAMKDIYLEKVGKKILVSVVISESSSKKSLNTEQKLLNEIKKLDYQITEVKKLEDVKSDSHVTLFLPQNLDQVLANLKENKPLQQKIEVQFNPSLDQGYKALFTSHLMISLQNYFMDEVSQEIKSMLEEQSGRELKSSPIQRVEKMDGVIALRSVQSIIPNPIQQSVPAWTLFGIFFIVIPLSNSMIRDRQSGVLRRLLSYPLSRSSLLVAKLIPFWIINQIQFILMLLVGVYIVPYFTSAQFQIGSLHLNLILVTMVCGLAATGYGLMISCLAKTNEQASQFGALSVVIMAVLGGVMIPHFVMPEIMQKIAFISPLYWGLEAYFDVFLREATLSVLAPKLLVLLAFSLICFIVSVFRFQWIVE